MKIAFVIIIGLLLGVTGVYFFYPKSNASMPIAPEAIDTIIEKPLEKYAIEKLSKNQATPSIIEIGEVISDEDKHTSYLFYYWVDGKKVSGQLNVPNEAGSYPIIIMFRGYAPVETYTTGVGTKRGAEYFANNGFVTLAPDFLGYGESDNPSTDIFEARFQTYTTAVTLLSSISNLNDALSQKGVEATIKPEKIGIWGHSNGGQIALTSLEVTGKSYPTVLWAPVSKPFPYSILYYTDEADDYGRAMRKKLAEFEENYNADNYSLINYLDRITAPLQLHQGVNDQEVPVTWSDELVAELEGIDKEIEYFTYVDADHNLMPTGWNQAIEHGANFYRKYLDKSASN